MKHFPCFYRCFTTHAGKGVHKDMILYHGTDEKSARNILTNGINISFCNEYTDFGKGFYTTDTLRSAEAWGLQRGRIEGCRGAVVSFQIDIMRLRSVLAVLEFETADLTWGQFVFNNRNNLKYAKMMPMTLHNHFAAFDVVIGPIADGSVSETAKYLRENTLPISQDILEKITQKDYGTQFSFHTTAAFDALGIPRVRLL